MGEGAGILVLETERRATARGARILAELAGYASESLAASHLTIYGYDRPTSPQLEKLHDARDLVAMRDAVVMGPHTRTSVPYIMTGLAGPDPNGRSAN